MYFNDTKIKPLENGESFFRNWTKDHWFIVGDKISYQVGDYKEPKKKYRIQGFILALGYSLKNEPMYLIGNVNTVIYDLKKDTYLSDKRSMYKWYTAKEIHALDDEDPRIKPKNIGYKANNTITRIFEGISIHILNIVKSTRYTKLSKYEINPEFNVEKTKLPYSDFAMRNESDSKLINHYSGIYAYYAKDQISAAIEFEKKNSSICRIEIIKNTWSKKKNSYIQKLPVYRYYVIVVLNKQDEKYNL